MNYYALRHPCTFTKHEIVATHSLWTKVKSVAPLFTYHVLPFFSVWLRYWHATLWKFKVHNVWIWSTHNCKISILFLIEFLFSLHSYSLWTQILLLMRFWLLRVLKSPSGYLHEFAGSFEKHSLHYPKVWDITAQKKMKWSIEVTGKGVSPQHLSNPLWNGELCLRQSPSNMTQIIQFLVHRRSYESEINLIVTFSK